MQKANEIQSNIYTLSKKIDEFENKKGEILFLNLIIRYFIIHFNYLQTTEKVNTSMDKKKYLYWLIQLSKDLNDLTNNPFYIKFMELHPDINLLILSLYGAIIEQEEIKETMINPQTFNLFYKMYQDLKNEIQNEQILSQEYFVKSDEVSDFLKGIVDSQTQSNKFSH